MAANRITLWTLESDATDREYFGKVDVGRASTLEALKVTLESNDILEWAFNFWDFEDKQRVRKKLERLNRFEKEVHVIRVGEGNSDGRKRRRLPDGSFTVTTAEVAAALEEQTQVQAEVTAPLVEETQVQEVEEDDPGVLPNDHLGLAEAQSPQRLTITR